MGTRPVVSDTRAAIPITGPKAGVGKADMMIAVVGVGIVAGTNMTVGALTVATGRVTPQKDTGATTTTDEVTTIEAIVGTVAIATTAGIVRATGTVIAGTILATGAEIVHVTGTGTVGIEIAGAITDETSLAVVKDPITVAETSRTIVGGHMVVVGRIQDVAMGQVAVTGRAVVMVRSVKAVAMVRHRGDQAMTVETVDARIVEMTVGMTVERVVETIEVTRETRVSEAKEARGISRNISWQISI